ncbi:Lrp/AsnC family transcriptional regulator [Rapidithrix thailandica]|uniref:Lrp/AsnC family transcriptional regulator n=1 Tax=Rapidithrix thailandica TaxID=413964 RepID=A0AAW9SL65_9BACT
MPWKQRLYGIFAFDYNYYFMDSISIKILKELQKNARLSFAEMGRNVGLSAPAVAERVQKMEEQGIIEGYGVRINLEKAGFPIQAQITIKTATHDFKRFISKLDNFPEVFDCVKVTGEHCAFLKVAVKNNQHLEDLIDRLTEYGHPNTSIILSSYTQNPAIE